MTLICDTCDVANDRCQCVQPHAESRKLTEEYIERSNRSTDFYCPVCSDQPLSVGTISGTQVCVCPNCEGFLIDSQSFGHLVGLLRADYRGADDPPMLMDAAAMNEKMSCPTCQQFMYTHPYHGPGNVVVNSCSDCQLNWLDAGELAAIVRAPGLRR